MRRASANIGSERLYYFMVATYMLFAIRDGLTGSIRYAFDLVGLGALWFVPDIMAFVATFLFFYQQCIEKKNFPGIFLVVTFLYSLMMSVVFMNDTVFSLFSTVKMFIPAFVGFMFMDRSATELRWARILLIVLFVASAIGLILNPYVDYPWMGKTISTLGVQKEATKLWWTQGAVRYGGLAGDSTMAAYMTVFVYILIAPSFSFLINIALWHFIYWALDTSTSKTAVGIFLIYIPFFFISYMVKSREQLMRVLRSFALLSFGCIFIPLALMLLAGGVDLAKIDPSLMSLGERINSTWQDPFRIIADIFPVGLFLGCGLGCYSYPMDYTPLASYNLPLDNFYLVNYLMMGLPFVVIVLFLFRGTAYTRDPIKLLLIATFNIYTITIQGYGPSFATLMFGYSFSEVFIGRRRETTVVRRSVGTAFSPLAPPPLRHGDTGGRISVPEPTARL